MKPVIQKCIDELRKPQGNKQYVLGMLEALLEMAESPEIVRVASPIVTAAINPPVAEAVPQVVRDMPKRNLMPPGMAAMFTPGGTPGEAVEMRRV